MAQLNKQPTRILAIAPCTRGFGYCVIENQDVLVDWAVTVVNGEKNSEAIKKVAELINMFHPEILVLENTTAKGSRRSARVRKLTTMLCTLAKQAEVKVELYTRAQVREKYLPEAQGTKQEMAKVIANRFPEELGHKLPPPRKTWKSESYWMCVFDAVALALMR